MWEAIAITAVISFFLGALITTLLAALSSNTTQDAIQQACLDCTSNKKTLLAEALQNDINWVCMDDDEIADRIIKTLYRGENTWKQKAQLPTKQKTILS